MLETPVLLIIFNRPHTTRRVLEVIRQAQPRQLFVAADGPRADHPDDEEKCRSARAVVDEMVDWPCDLHTNYAEENMGCGPRPATAITWFFEHVEQGIILEDDCVPHPTFFRFCEELLEYYKDNERVMHISGDNFQYGRKRGNASYYFSTFTHTWGWATWRRAWQFYDFELAPLEARNHIWDHQWLKSVKRHNGVAVLPNVNLVSNIGFGADATHSFTRSAPASIPTVPIDFPLLHPNRIEVDRAADNHTSRVYFQEDRSARRKFVRRLKNLVPLSVRHRLKQEWLSLRSLNHRPHPLKPLYVKYHGYSMLPQNIFLGNLDLCREYAKIDGCVVECGVWRGGMSAAMAEVLGPQRAYYLFDSFEGLPPAKDIDGVAALAWQQNTTSPLYFDNCRAEMSFAQEAMKLSHVKDYHLFKGWFAETLPFFYPPTPIAILRLDGDWYDSTFQCLTHLYHLVASGGVTIVDDYYTWDGCARAVHDFLSANKIPDRIRMSAAGVCYLVKGAA
jgi:hypothetical protein